MSIALLSYHQPNAESAEESTTPIWSPNARKESINGHRTLQAVAFDGSTNARGCPSLLSITESKSNNCLIFHVINRSNCLEVNHIGHDFVFH